MAGVTIAAISGDNGILQNAARAKEETEQAEKDEKDILTDYENYLSQYTNGGFIEDKGVNAPLLRDGMELVIYDEEKSEWVVNNSTSSFEYVAANGTDDNNSSRWANAKVVKDGVASYFVWIPRFAYKINYTNPDNISEGGTIDVKFLIGITDNYYKEDGTLQTAKRVTTGNEDTSSDYYVHPAFTSNMNFGGWKNELTGIWVGKYETSLVDKTDRKNIINIITIGEMEGDILLSNEVNVNKEIAIKPGMSSWRFCTIENMYTNARNYEENLNSHMLKNSEWGAVAYLTYSKYGRNGHEITKNADTKTNYLTAEGDIELNKKQSSTGNVYGIYDLSGGTNEMVATYLLNENFSDSNSIFMNGISNEFLTVYEEENGKIGDATFETSSWEGDRAKFITLTTPFFRRGGYSGYPDTEVGIFCYDNISEGKNSFSSFRICLC